MPGVSMIVTLFQSNSPVRSVVMPAPMAISSLPVRALMIVDLPELYWPANARLIGEPSLSASGRRCPRSRTSLSLESSSASRASPQIRAVASAHRWVSRIAMARSSNFRR